jgi:hypothetical protein
MTQTKSRPLPPALALPQFASWIDPPRASRETDEVERVLADVDTDRGDNSSCLLRCAHRMLLEPCFTPPSHSPAN